MRTSGLGWPCAMNCAIDQILRLAPSISPDIEPVVSSAKTSSTRGATLGTCTLGGFLTSVTIGSFVGKLVPRWRGIAEAAHAARTTTPLKSPYVTNLRLSMTSSSAPGCNARGAGKDLAALKWQVGDGGIGTADGEPKAAPVAGKAH